MKVTSATATPIAFRDPPLLNVVRTRSILLRLPLPASGSGLGSRLHLPRPRLGSWLPMLPANPSRPQGGVHEPFALRSIIQVHTDDGRCGLGESYGDEQTLAHLDAIAPKLVGVDPFDLNALARVCSEVVDGTSDTGRSYEPSGSRAVSVAVSALEVAFLDLQGQALGKPLCDILGGAVRDRVPYSAYLFYKFGQHQPGGIGRPDDPAFPPDKYGECLTHEQVVGQCRRFIDEFGFSSIKLKGGVFDPDYEIATLRALREAFPQHPLRIDPNGGWTVDTTRRVMPQLYAPPRPRAAASRVGGADTSLRPGTGCWSTSRTRRTHSPRWERWPRSPPCRSQPTVRTTAPRPRPCLA